MLGDLFHCVVTILAPVHCYIFLTLPPLHPSSDYIFLHTIFCSESHRYWLSTAYLLTSAVRSWSTVEVHISSFFRAA